MDTLSFGAGMIVGGVIASVLWVVVVHELDQRRQKQIASMVHNAATQVFDEIQKGEK